MGSVKSHPSYPGPRVAGRDAHLHIPGPRRSAESLPPRPTRTRRARVLRAAVALLVVVPLLALAWGGVRLTTALDRIDGAFEGLGDRPPAAIDGSVSMLLLGTADGRSTGPTVSWMDGAPTVVSAMLVDISGDRRQVAVDWLPLRDGILEGIADSRPSRSVAAVESWTGTRVDHLAVVDWAAFTQLGRDNDATIKPPSGPDREDQQAFLREVLDNTLHAEMRREPWTLYDALHTVAEDLAVEEGWSTVDMARLVVSLRDLRSAQIDFGDVDEPVSSCTADC